MEFLETSYTNSVEPLHTSYPLNTQALATDTDNHELKIKSLIYKMIWDFGLACFNPTRRRRASGKDNGDDKDDKGCVSSLEHNKAWLLAESGACGTELINADPHSVHSSFRELKWRKIQSLERSISPVTHSLIRFTYAEIASATLKFSKGRVLGRGALSYVFRGRVRFMRTTVAIKQLDREDKESPKAFCRELMIASSLHNPYIVPLVGFCIDPEEGFFLVYKYVSGGSLERYLHDKKKRGVKDDPALPWSTRYKVAVGIADSIGYLHCGTERCVVHRDIKPSNILLSSKKTPKLCDFGLATSTPAPSVPFLLYLAPEYFQHGKISDRTDVYAFGVVLLELLTGRKPIESKRGPREENLVLWAKPLLQQGTLEKLLDPRLKSPQKNLDQIARMTQAATACIHSEESRRSNMDEIIVILRCT
ncbi:hypothetical protein K7X08_018510 [Anisodus acutangulus]|uniref:Protein kinase domain-containing protein n=1 Tax=Anisodus acutangulus TaxID=402998 RepID=A0A9Q1R9K8_9SOLA|nr:hypothetical protein K7X08_018510 [Anisodus acutangulus]